VPTPQSSPSPGTGSGIGSGTGSDGDDPRVTALLAAAVGDPDHTVVGLDFDGTLAPLVPDPDDSRPLPGTVEVLSSLGAAGVTVVVVTGRSPEVAARLLGLTGDGGAARGAVAPRLRRLVIHGHYGLQTWSAADGSLTSMVDERSTAAISRVRAQLPGVLAELGAADGVTVEDKDVSLVVHTRRAADPQGSLDAVTPALTAVATAAGLEVQPGRFVCEIRPGGVDKGDTLTGVMDRAGAVAALYAGDDVGDLPAWAALGLARDRGVTTLGVASGQAQTPGQVERAADFVVDGPVGVLALLRQLADALD